MKIWMSKQTNRRNLFAAHTIAGMLGILLLAALLIAGTAALVLASEEYKEASALLLCLLVSAVLIFLACRLGRSRLRDAVIFFKDDEDRLYVLDARQCVPYRRGFTGSIRSSMEIQQRIGNHDFLRIPAKTGWNQKRSGEERDGSAGGGGNPESRENQRTCRLLLPGLPDSERPGPGREMDLSSHQRL